MEKKDNLQLPENAFRELKDGEEYKPLMSPDKVYPEVNGRHSDYTVEYHVRPFTIEESQVVFDTNPKNLSLEEMFRLALTYTPGSATYNKIFMTAVQLFPDNPTANLNAACIALIQKDTKTAAVFLEKAPPLPETTLAKGVLCFLQGNYKEAEALFRQSKDAGLLQADDNLKQILEVE